MQTQTADALIFSRRAQQRYKCRLSMPSCTGGFSSRLRATTTYIDDTLLRRSVGVVGRGWPRAPRASAHNMRCVSVSFCALSKYTLWPTGGEYALTVYQVGGPKPVNPKPIKTAYFELGCALDLYRGDHNPRVRGSQA